ncbi:hypothetical protein TPHA_0B00920 [Tetrapisispora phaffii CBS 4417]|uniref:Uncharacterized protein n=1 Tax=Tetrapisispora phaffii (strain ATCC 24235 / CBS 4417 / NBRC 1672 / NRRL Y-8282 / UCD 70-5) TaxID=1071381 RepID=G8BQG7_TETPH|nr:hypothetical protein TPHA_0B00920 [Tetrapisispora phaffii CBS 4417]CCE61764.1 hypothetical protein TPHA_0B00920 [Tetrapisispora phaffii CBS 4417]
MDVLKNCRVYKLSSFKNPTEQFIKLEKNEINITNNPVSLSLILDKIKYLHLIEHEFKLSNFKCSLAQSCIKNLQADGKGNEKCILVIDIISAWKKYLLNKEYIASDVKGSSYSETDGETTSHENSQIPEPDSTENNEVGVYYLNSSDILNMEGILKFFSKLNENPIETLEKYCHFPKTVNFKQQLSGIIVDNISYFAHDNHMNIQQNTAHYSTLLNMFKTLRKTFGCWVISVSYGMEFYDGVELSTSSIYRSGSHTRVPINYTSGMDTILLRDTESTGRFCNI